jgi:hypothetical protein
MSASASGRPHSDGHGHGHGHGHGEIADHHARREHRNPLARTTLFLQHVLHQQRHIRAVLPVR